MKKYFLLLLLLINFNSWGQRIKNVDFIQNEEKIIIKYDLIGRNEFNVVCYYTINDGRSYIRLKSIEGDVGNNIKPGVGKQIVWYILKDTDGIKGEIQFKIAATEVNKILEPYVSVGTTAGLFNQYQSGRYSWTARIGILPIDYYGIGLSVSFSRYDHEKFSYGVEDLICKRITFSPIYSYLFNEESRTQIIGTLQTGLVINKFKYTLDNNLIEESFLSYADNFKLGIIINWVHFHVFIDYGFEKGCSMEQADISTDNYEYENNHFMFFGFGYNF
jgi:hypothetical protein